MKPHASRLLAAAAALAWATAAGQAPPSPAATAPNPFAKAAQRAAAAASAAAAAVADAASAVTAGPAAVAAQAASAAAAAGSAAEAVAGAASAPATARKAPAATAPRAPASAAASASSAAAGPAAAASTPALCVRASDGDSFCADTLQLIFKTVTLPSGRRGNAYGPRRLVQGGTPPYDLGLASGKLPPGMELSDDGHLGGVPTATGLHHFTLAVRDASTPPLSVQQRYALRINAPRPPPAAAPASAPDPAPPTLTAVGKKDAEAVASLLSQTHLRAYKLSADDLKKLATPPEPPEPPPAEPAAQDAALPDVDLTAAPPPPAASAPPPEPRPTPDQLKDMLTPLLDVEYPTRTLFETALEARRCAYFKLLVSEAARKQGLASVPGCPLDPQPPADAAAMAAASAPARGRTAPTAAAPASPLPMPSLAPALGTTTAAAAGTFNKVSASLATGTAAGTRLLGSSSSGSISGSTAAAPAAAAPGKAAAADGDIPLDRLYAMLLPDGLKTEIITTALKLHDSTLAKPVHWTGDGCGCRPLVGPGGNDVYGFYPFWMAQDDRQAIDFSLFTRIGYVGPVLDDNGEYLMPPHWNDSRRDFIRTAHRHGVDVDLVIYRRDWPRLLNLSTQQQQTFIRKAAARAVALADTQLTDRSKLRGYLLPVWTERTHVYSGITVFFDDLPTEPAQADQFRSFFRRFMDELIRAMQKDGKGRSYALSIVIPDHLLGDEAAAYNFSDLRGYIERAENGSRNPTRAGSAESPGAIDRMDYKGTTDISVLLLVLLSEPTSDTKKIMRARMDNTDAMHGHQRVAFLNSIMPVMFHPVSDPAAPLPKPRQDRLNIDLSYVEWQFGGVGFWPVPLKPAKPAEPDMESVTGVLKSNEFLGPTKSTLSPLCTYVCPNRSIVRLLFEVLLVVGVVSLGAYAWVCEVRRLGMKFVLFLWIGGVSTLLVGMALLSCDPDLLALRRGDNLFYALILALTVGGLYMTFKPRVDPP